MMNMHVYIMRVSLILSREIESIICYMNGNNNGQPARYQDLLTSLKPDGSNLDYIKAQFNVVEQNDTPKEDIPHGVETAANFKAAEICLITSIGQYVEDDKKANDLTVQLYMAMAVGNPIGTIVNLFDESTRIAPFIERVVKGRDHIGRIDRVIEDWHQYQFSNKLPLHEYLGFTKDEYSLFVQDAGNLQGIIDARKSALNPTASRKPHA